MVIIVVLISIICMIDTMVDIIISLETISIKVPPLSLPYPQGTDADPGIPVQPLTIWYY